MKNYEYIVFFGITIVKVYAGNPFDAAILAMAERVKSGLNRDITLLACMEEGREESFRNVRIHFSEE
jgi:hypothetical protein